MRVNIIVSATDELSIMETNVGHIGEHNISTLVFSGEIFEAEYYRLVFRRLCETLESEKLQLTDGQIVYPLPQSLLKSRSLEVQLVGYTSENGEITKIQKSDIIQLQISPSIQSPSNQLDSTADDNGPQGKTPNLQIGEVTTLPVGSDATASITGTPENPLLNLGLPCGTGGDAEWREITSVTLTENVHSVSITLDADGKPFYLNDFCLAAGIVMTEASGNSTLIALKLNDTVYSDAIRAKEYTTSTGGYFGVAHNCGVIISTMPNSTTANGFGAVSANKRPFVDFPVTKITLTPGAAAANMKTGSIITLYGKDKQ